MEIALPVRGGGGEEFSLVLFFFYLFKSANGKENLVMVFLCRKREIRKETPFSK